MQPFLPSVINQCIGTLTLDQAHRPVSQSLYMYVHCATNGHLPVCTHKHCQDWLRPLNVLGTSPLHIGHDDCLQVYLILQGAYRTPASLDVLASAVKTPTAGDGETELQDSTDMGHSTRPPIFR